MRVVHDERSNTAAFVSASVSVNIHTMKKSIPEIYDDVWLENSIAELYHSK